MALPPAFLEELDALGIGLRFRGLPRYALAVLFRAARAGDDTLQLAERWPAQARNLNDSILSPPGHEFRAELLVVQWQRRAIDVRGILPNVGSANFAWSQRDIEGIVLAVSADRRLVVVLDVLLSRVWRWSEEHPMQLVEAERSTRTRWSLRCLCPGLAYMHVAPRRAPQSSYDQSVRLRGGFR